MLRAYCSALPMTAVFLSFEFCPKAYVVGFVSVMSRLHSVSQNAGLSSLFCHYLCKLRILMIKFILQYSNERQSTYFLVFVLKSLVCGFCYHFSSFMLAFLVEVSV